MKLKKIIAGIAAAAVAVSMMAVNAFATVELDSEYPGAWGASAAIPKSEFTAVGGDVKVVLTIEVYDPVGLEKQYVFRPFNADTWDDWTPYITSDTVIAKDDGMFCVRAEDTTVEFVVSQAGIDEMCDNGMAFQVSGVIIKSADLSAGTPQAELYRVSDADGVAYSKGELADPRGGAAAPAADEGAADDAAPADDAADTTADTGADAPAAETTTTAAATTTAPATGNTPVAVMVSVMAVAGVAAVAAKKRK